MRSSRLTHDSPHVAVRPCESTPALPLPLPLPLAAAPPSPLDSELDPPPLPDDPDPPAPMLAPHAHASESGQRGLTRIVYTFLTMCT